METCSLIFVLWVSLFNADLRSDLLDGNRVIIQNNSSPNTYCIYGNNND